MAKTRFRCLRRQAALGGLVLACAVAGCSRIPEGKPAPGLAPAWDLAARQLVPEALRELPPETAFTAGGARREAEFARALLLLNAQPKTQANIADATRRLQAIRAAVGKADPVGRKAVFTLARIAQWHAAPPDPARAAALYAELMTGNDALAQAARVQRAELRLFENPYPADDAGLRARLQSLEGEARGLTDAGARRDFHLLMADGYRELAAGSADAELLSHLLEAKAAGVRRLTRLNLCAEAGELARRLGRNDVAAAHFREFLAISSRDLRTAAIRQRLAELENAAATPRPAGPT